MLRTFLYMTGIARLTGAALLFSLASPATGHAADLQPRTVAAFDRYVHAIEAQMSRRSEFLRIDTGSDRARSAAHDALARGELLVDAIDPSETGINRDVPDGLLHHWAGTLFVPGTTLDATLALLQDYDHHARIYAPAVRGSKLVARDGDRFRMHLRFTMTRIITVVVDTDNEAVFTRDARDRGQSRIHSTRIAQVENADMPGEHERPVGHDDGYLWRLNTYWRLLERDAGVYVECESISLTRDIPFGFGWLVRPFVTSLPKDSLEFTLGRTRQILMRER
ncbi:MAG TPA: hypothetical protein VL173_02080 [Vicinamibacterales bacterium]|nr:hypothetical protein [Vicinamibacterales bacterium]